MLFRSDEARRTQLLREAQRQVLDVWPDIYTHTGLTTTVMHPTVRNLDLGGTFDAAHSIRYGWLKA